MSPSPCSSSTASMAETDPEWAAGRRARVVHCARGGGGGSACSRRLQGCEMSSAPVHRVASRRERDLWRRPRRSSRCGEASGRRRARRRRRRVLRAWWRLQRRACPVARGMSDWTGQQRGEGEGTDGGVPESDEMAAREGDEAVLRAGGRGVVARARCRDVALLDSTHQSSAAELDGDDELLLRSRRLSALRQHTLAVHRLDELERSHVGTTATAKTTHPAQGRKEGPVRQGLSVSSLVLISLAVPRPLTALWPPRQWAQ